MRPCRLGIVSSFRDCGSGHDLSVDDREERSLDPEPRRVSEDAAVAAAPPVTEPAPPSDAGEPMGSKNRDRPAMLGKRFRLTTAAGMTTGLIVALVARAIAGGTTGLSWLLAGVGGLAVGGALTLFLYGVSTDRTDTDPDKAHGRADVTTRGEWRRTLDRRRRSRRPR